MQTDQLDKVKCVIGRLENGLERLVGEDSVSSSLMLSVRPSRAQCIFRLTCIPTRRTIAPIQIVRPQFPNCIVHCRLPQALIKPRRRPAASSRSSAHTYIRSHHLLYDSPHSVSDPNTFSNCEITARETMLRATAADWYTTPRCDFTSCVNECGRAFNLTTRSQPTCHTSSQD